MDWRLECLPLDSVHSSIRAVDKWTFGCPMDISVRPLDEWTFECPMDISVYPMDEWTFKCPLDISVRLMDEWTFIYVQWTCNVYDAKEAVMT